MNTRTCQQCRSVFGLEAADFEIYKKFNVPEPTYCPPCRQQRRLAWRCERSLHYRKCDLCGKDHLSSYREDARFPVYCVDCYYSDKWDQFQYGRDFDFSRPFFEQFAELQDCSPRASLFITIGTIENSPYANTATHIKNCYLVFAATTVEDSYYSNMIRDSFSITDCTEIYHSELCSDSVNVHEGYCLIHCLDVRNCRDSAFLFDCIGSSDCFMSANLRNKKFVFRNQQLTETEYHERMKQINLQSSAVYQHCVKEFEVVQQQAIHKYYHGFNNESAVGDYMINCANSQYLQDCFAVENSRYVSRMYYGKELYDVDYFGSPGTEVVYNSVSVGIASSFVKLSSQVWNGCYDIEYCDNVLNGSKSCFGSVSLCKAEHVIFNTQYLESEYVTLKEKIIEHMRETGEYGQFFPPQLSHIPYNDSIAQDYFPLTATTAHYQGFRWADDVVQPKPATAELPDHIDNMDETWTKYIFMCAQCGKNYKLIVQEIALYKKIHVPVPRACFDCRVRERLARKNPRRLWTRQCMNQGCSNTIETSYAPDRPEQVYCEDCYKKAIY